MNESKIRQVWASKLWQRKGYDSPDEFKEHGNCFACGLNAGKLKASDTGSSNVASVEGVHLLCEYCRSDSKGLKGFSYWRWFLNRKATDTIAAATLKRLAKV